MQTKEIKGENMNIFKQQLKQGFADSQRIEAAKILLELGTEDENLRMSLCKYQDKIQAICRENLTGIELLKRGKNEN